MIFRSRGYKNVHFENFSMAGNNIETVESYKYSGHIITDDLSDNSDIFRQIKQT